MKLLASQLEQTDIIEHAYIERQSVHAAYKTGIRDYYFYRIVKRRKKRHDNCFFLTPELAVIRKEIPIFKEFRNDPLDDSPTYHWCINRTQFNEATIVEQRIAMHRLFREILNTKPEPDWYPDNILESDWQLLQETGYEKYFVNGAVTCFPRGRPPTHFRILEHFFNPGAHQAGKMLWKALRNICNKKQVCINSSNVRKITRWFTRRRIISPLVYCAIFKALKITGPVGDLHPGFGSKAIACAMMGLPYFTVKDERFEKAIEAGFASFVQGNFGWLDGQKLDLLISDNNFDGFEMPSGDILSQTKQMICYASRRNKQELIDQYKPTSVLQLYDHAVEAKTFKGCNYLLLW